MRIIVKELIGTLIIAIVIFILLRLVVGSYAVASDVMEPGLQAGERLLINKTAYLFSEPERGDIIYFKSPGGDINQMKRIICLPGDIIEVQDHAVYINGIKLREPYVKDPPGYTLSAFQVPVNNYFVLGDNRNNSNDSSTGWTVPRENILGRAWLLTWPPENWGGIQRFQLGQQLAAAETP
jgi:signal peptidase I